MTLLRNFLFAGAALCLSAVAAPLPAEADTADDLQTVGTASFHVGWIHVYDAELRATGGEFNWDAPFELALTYGRKIGESRLVNSTISEMSRHTGAPEASFSKFEEPLKTCFADVKKGDQFIAKRESADMVRFTLNGTETCTFEQDNASRLFFGIWLSDKTRSDAQSRKLRGLKK